MLQRLTKRRAAVAQAIDAGTHIEMSVEVEDAHLLARSQVAKIVAIGCFMSAAQDDGNRAGSQDCAHYLAESGLSLLQLSIHAQVAKIEWRPRCQVGVTAAVPGR